MRGRGKAGHNDNSAHSGAISRASCEYRHTTSCRVLCPNLAILTTARMNERTDGRPAGRQAGRPVVRPFVPCLRLRLDKVRKATSGLLWISRRPPVGKVTDRPTDRQTDRQTNESVLKAASAVSVRSPVWSSRSWIFVETSFRTTSFRLRSLCRPSVAEIAFQIVGPARLTNRRLPLSYSMIMEPHAPADDENALSVPFLSS